MAGVGDTGLSAVDLIVNAIKDKFGLLSDEDKKRIKDTVDKNTPVDDPNAYEVDPNNPPNQWGSLLASMLGIQGDPTKTAEEMKNIAYVGILIVVGLTLFNFLFKE